MTESREYRTPAVMNGLGRKWRGQGVNELELDVHLKETYLVVPIPGNLRHGVYNLHETLVEELGVEFAFDRPSRHGVDLWKILNEMLLSPY